MSLKIDLYNGRIVYGRTIRSIVLIKYKMLKIKFFLRFQSHIVTGSIHCIIWTCYFIICTFEYSNNKSDLIKFKKILIQSVNIITYIFNVLRLNTILDSNRVMVLDAGKIAEFDSPQNLMKDTSSIFYGMAKNAGLVAD